MIGDPMSIIKRIRTWFKPKTNDKYDINELIDEIDDLIVQNKIGNLEIDREIERNKLFESVRIERIKEGIDNKHIKNLLLREILSYRKRLTQLDRCNDIYQINIDVNSALKTKLEDMLAAGLKSVSQKHVS